ncbi:MAG: hypothetical protein LBE34_12415 [Flavobacteriaceae bacterium]|jgi:hypothetical protein|nr:hypothetical protein [Flavobacteriaceae bacterium]
MNKTLLFALIATTFYNSYAISTPLEKGKTKKITVVDYLIEKEHEQLPASSEDDKDAVTYELGNETIATTNKVYFLYNEKGQLATLTSVKTDNDTEKPNYTTLFYYDDNNLLTSVFCTKDNASHTMDYVGGKVRHLVYKERGRSWSMTSTIDQGQNDQPFTMEIKNSDTNYKPREIVIEYDEKLNAIGVITNDQKEEYSFDNKRSPFDYLPFAFNMNIFLMPEELIYTNYVPKKNIVKLDREEWVETMTYTYNSKNLPQTVKIMQQMKGSDYYYYPIYEYEYFYKEIEIVE